MMDFYAKHSNDGRRIFATHWVSGVTKPTQMNGNLDAMDVDASEAMDATTTHVLVVAENDLESA